MISFKANFMKMNNALRTPALALVFCVLSGPSLLGQITQDYLQFSQVGQFGSARMQSMANAFHALGSGVTSLHLNPAASAVNSDSKMALGLSFDQNQNLSNYNGQESSSEDDYFGFAHVGALLVAEQIDQTNPWRKISFGFSMATLKNFDQSIFASGNTQTGLSHYFANHAQGTALGELQLGNGESLSSAYSYLGNELGRGAQLGLLAYQAYLIDPENESSNNVNYLVATNDQRRQNTYMELGGAMRQFNLNIATQYGDHLLMGMNLNSHVLRYTRSTSIKEYAVSENSPLQNLTYNNFERTDGEGFSLQLGAIYAPGAHWRMSLSYDSPTWWQLNEESAESLSSSVLVDQGLDNYVMDPEVRNFYEPYRLRTPGQWNAGLAYVFGPQGLISASLSQKDYSSGAFNEDGSSFFNNANNTINQEYTQSMKLSLGGEYRFGPWRLRAGYWQEEQALKNTDLSDNFGMNYGIGFYGGGWAIDAAFVNTVTYAYSARYLLENQFSNELKSNSLIISLALDL